MTSGRNSIHGQRQPISAWQLCGLAALAIGVPIGASAAGGINPMAFPGEPGWDTESACTQDSQFIEVTDQVPYQATLLSRHVYCIKKTGALEQSFFMDIMKSVDGKSWVPYQPGSGTQTATCLAGKGKLDTYFQATGPAATPEIEHRIKLKLAEFTRNTGTPGDPGDLGGTVCPSGELTAQIVVQLPQSPAVGSSVGTPYNLRITHDLPTLNLKLTKGGSVGHKAFTAKVNWDAVADKSYLYFQYAPLTMDYTVNNAARIGGLPFQPLYTELGAVPSLRCDVGGLAGATPKSRGCVFPEAAAVFVLDSGNATIKESIEHIRMATQGLSPGMTQPAPIGFKLNPLTRAVGMGGVDSPQMQRADSAENVLNREAACTRKNSASLVRTREINHSQFCVSSTPNKQAANCQCDEYPFAATRQGGAFNPGATSVRDIKGVDNKAVGDALGSFLTKQRVVVGNADAADGFWVLLK